jgi:Zn-dependent peptidase ImmA (M78 family)
MAQNRAYINKETLAFICSQIGVSVSFLAQKTRYKEEQIRSWLDETNDDLPTFTQAKCIAKVLRIPFAGLYMRKENVPIRRLPSFRNLRTLQNRVTLDDSLLNIAIAELIRYHNFLSSSESDLGISSIPPLLPIISDSASVIDYATTIRTFYDIKLADQLRLKSPRQFYLYVRQKIENKGIFIHCFTGVDVEIARGISIYNEATPIIGINDKDRYPAKTFSMIHELVHIIKRQSTLCNEMYASFTSSREEVFCNAVAGEVLVPEASLHTYLTANNITGFNLDNIEKAAKRFNISKEVIIRRLFDTKKLTKDEYDTFANEILHRFLQERENEKIARQEGHGKPIIRSISREAIDKCSPSICKILLIGYNEGYFSRQEVSGFLGIKERYIPEFFSEVVRW